jgi:hypothetical protein
MKLKIMEPSPTAPICISESRPIRAVSTVLSKGTEILLNILGIASLRISLFNTGFYVLKRINIRLSKANIKIKGRKEVKIMPTVIYSF